MLIWNSEIFVLGALGAFAPEVLRLWTLRDSVQRIAWSNRYVIASVFMCALGGVVALCLEPNTAWKALYGGLSTPVLITAAGRRITAPKAVKQKNNGTLTSAPPVQASASTRAFFGAL